MGRQSRCNPTAIAAKNGELPPKKKKMSKGDLNRLLSDYLENALMPKYIKGDYYEESSINSGSHRHCM